MLGIFGLSIVKLKPICKQHLNPLSIGRIHLKVQGWWVVIYTSILIANVHSVSKYRTCSDAMSDLALHSDMQNIIHLFVSYINALHAHTKCSFRDYDSCTLA